MSRIGATLSGVERTLLNRLAEANAAATINSLRLATGKKINYPSDDPAAFVTLSGLQGRLSLVSATMSNVTAAASIISQTQTTLDQIRTQLNTIHTELLKDEDRTLSASERAEAQANIDSAIDQINSLAATDVDGRRVLDGSAEYDVSGRNSTQVADLVIHATVDGSTPTISGTVTQAATQADLVYTGASGQTTAAATFTLTGTLGSAPIIVTDSEDLDDVAERINDNSHKTGITASVDGNELTLTTVGYGTGATASVEVTLGTFNVTGAEADGVAYGTDAVAEINGQTYSGNNVSGNRFTVSQNGFRYEIEFIAGYSGDFDSITVSGSALTFALSTSLTHRSALSIPAVHANTLGGLSGTLDQIASGGTVSGLDDKTSHALRIVDEALGELDRIDGTVDGFYDAAITSSSNLLAKLQEDLEEAIAETDGYDENEETLLLAKNQQLASNAIAGLTILNQQRAAIVDLIQAIAGLS